MGPPSLTGIAPRQFRIGRFERKEEPRAVALERMREYNDPYSRGRPLAHDETVELERFRVDRLMEILNRLGPRIELKVRV